MLETIQEASWKGYRSRDEVERQSEGDARASIGETKERRWKGGYRSIVGVEKRQYRVDRRKGGLQRLEKGTEADRGGKTRQERKRKCGYRSRAEVEKQTEGKCPRQYRMGK